MTVHPIERRFGRLPLTFAATRPWQVDVSVRGGPYDCFPGLDSYFGVCVRAEQAFFVPRDVWLPIQDFGVPMSSFALDEALRAVLKQLCNSSDKRPVWVGCAGGVGRTGLMLGLLAKIAEHSNVAAFRDAPRDLVRRFYHPLALETAEQERFLEEFDAAPYARYATWECFKSWLKRSLRFWR